VSGCLVPVDFWRKGFYATQYSKRFFLTLFKLLIDIPTEWPMLPRDRVDKIG
jgi:hypothetical protein